MWFGSDCSDFIKPIWIQCEQGLTVLLLLGFLSTTIITASATLIRTEVPLWPPETWPSALGMLRNLLECDNESLSGVLGSIRQYGRFTDPLQTRIRGVFVCKCTVIYRTSRLIRTGLTHLQHSSVTLSTEPPLSTFILGQLLGALAISSVLCWTCRLKAQLGQIIIEQGGTHWPQFLFIFSFSPHEGRTRSDTSTQAATFNLWRWLISF